MTEIKNKVKEFIIDNFLVDFNDEVDENTNLFKSGFIDSFGFLELVTFLEQTFQIKIADNELVSDDLVSVTNMVTCINRKLYESREAS